MVVVLPPGEAGPLLLDNPKNNFERNTTDVFKINAEDVGELTRCRVWSDNKGMGASWHLDIITIINGWGMSA